jgi:hypothetical protein
MRAPPRRRGWQDAPPEPNSLQVPAVGQSAISSWPQGCFAPLGHDSLCSFRSSARRRAVAAFT